MCARLHTTTSYDVACRTLVVALLCMLSALSASASPPSTQAQARPDKDLLAFIADKHVTRDEVVAHLGQPHASFENDSVIAYRLGQSDGGYYVVSAPQKKTELDWQGVDYDLMLHFDDQGILQEHNLIAIRSASQPR